MNMHVLQTNIAMQHSGWFRSWTAPLFVHGHVHLTQPSEDTLCLKIEYRGMYRRGHERVITFPHQILRKGLVISDGNITVTFSDDASGSYVQTIPKDIGIFELNKKKSLIFDPLITLFGAGAILLVLAAACK